MPRLVCENPDHVRAEMDCSIRGVANRSDATQLAPSYHNWCNAEFTPDPGPESEPSAFQKGDHVTITGQVLGVNTSGSVRVKLRDRGGYTHVHMDQGELTKVDPPEPTDVAYVELTQVDTRKSKWIPDRGYWVNKGSTGQVLDRRTWGALCTIPGTLKAYKEVEL